MKNDFFKYQAQTSPHPLALEISHAKGSFIYDTSGKKYLDFVAGVSANTLGHNHKKINKAITKQLKKHTHVMVYGEFVQKPQVDLCKLLVKYSPKNLNSVYLTNSGTEATEGAIKLAKRVTKRTEIVAAKMSYHGNTMGAMSVSGVEQQNSAFRPLIPGARFISYNNDADLDKITHNTAAVILETIQGGAGFITPKNEYLKKVKAKCDAVCALLILDEIQTGIGRTGTFWGFENYKVIPDIIITGKGLGGGMPIGAFMASYKMMQLLQNNPKLGHISTFAGHPVIAAAGKATLKELHKNNLITKTLQKEQLFRTTLKHPLIKEVRGNGLMLAIILTDDALTATVVKKCLDNGLILFFLLFETKALRVTPPLNISNKEIKKGCKILLNVLDSLS